MTANTSDELGFLYPINIIDEKLFIEKKLLYNLYNQKNYLMKNMFI